MNYICDQCNNNIQNTAPIYFGFDSKCCSQSCRYKIAKKNFEIDKRMLFPSYWIANKNKIKTNIEVTPYFYYSKK
tara:strand:- start:3420 stop:3644 length:225 start_codon:yes stop_codon:yes gene_type:complete